MQPFVNARNKLASETMPSTLITPELSADTVARTHFLFGRTEERDYAVRIAERKGDEDLDESWTIRDRHLVELTAIREVNREAERRSTSPGILRRS
jgi:hypothetical protein